MKEKFSKLIDVKSIVTIMLAVVFCIQTLRGVFTGDQFLTIFTVVVAFYFGVQYAKKAMTAAEKTEV